MRTWIRTLPPIRIGIVKSPIRKVLVRTAALYSRAATTKILRMLDALADGGLFSYSPLPRSRGEGSKKNPLTPDPSPPKQGREEKEKPPPHPRPLSPEAGARGELPLPSGSDGRAIRTKMSCRVGRVS